MAEESRDRNQIDDTNHMKHVKRSLTAMILLLTVALAGCTGSSSTSNAEPVPILETPKMARDAVQQENDRTNDIQQSMPTVETETR